MTRSTQLDPALMKRLENDRQRRTRRDSSPPVYEIAAEQATRLVPEGAALVLAANRDLSLLNQVVAAVQSGDVTRMNAVAESIGRVVSRFEPGPKSTEQALDELLTFPVHGELSYSDKPLLGTIVVADGGALSGAYLPYTGGRLAPDKFRVVEYARPGVSDSLQVVIIIRPPRLTPVEISALKAVGPDHTEAFIGTTPLGYLWVAVLVVAAVVVLTAMGQACASEAVGGLSQEERDRLGPSPSVDDLLAARTRMLSAR